MAKLDLAVDVDVKGDKKLHNLGSGLLDVAKLAAGAVAGLGAVGFLTSGFASDLNESLSKVNVVFGDSAKEIEDWSKTAATAMGLSQQQALEAAGTFGNLFDAMGLGEKASVDMSQELVQLASDLASFNNIKPEEALEKLRAGLVGEAEPLRTLGVNISAAATEAKALELGLLGDVDGLSAADKAMANYAIIMEQTTNAQGDFARTSEGMANQQRTLGAVFADTMASVGQAFIPLIESLLPQITAGLQSFGGWITANMPTIQAVLTNVLSGIGAAFSFLTTTVLPIVVNAFSFLAKNIFPAAGKAISGVSQIFQGLVAWVKQNLPTISSVAGQVFGAVSNVLKVLGPILIEIAKVLLPAIGTAASIAFKILDVAFKGIGGAAEVLGNVFGKVAGFVRGLFRGLVGFIKGIWNAFVGFWNSIQISVPSVDIPGIGKVGGFSIGLPDLPMLASGGIVTEPTIAMLGERGPEAVVPLDKMQGQTTIIEVTVLGDLKAEDERSLADAIGRVQWASGFSDQVLSGG